MYCTTDSRPRIEVVAHDRPDAPEKNITFRMRGRNKEVHQRGVDYRKQIEELEKQLFIVTEDSARYRSSLDRARSEVARLSDHSGLCAKLREQIKQQQAWLTEWRAGCDTLKAEAAAKYAELAARLAVAQELAKRNAPFADSHADLVQSLIATRSELDAKHKKLLEAEQALRYAQRARTKSDNQLITVGAQLAASQTELLTSSSRIIDLQQRILGQHIAAPSDPAIGVTAPDSPPADGEAPSPAPTDAGPMAAAGLTYTFAPGPPDDVASILVRDADADVNAYVLSGEPVSPDGTASDDSLFDLAATLAAWTDLDPDGPAAPGPSSFPDTHLGFDPLSPRPAGATSPTCSPRFAFPSASPQPDRRCGPL